MKSECEKQVAVTIAIVRTRHPCTISLTSCALSRNTLSTPSLPSLSPSLQAGFKRLAEAATPKVAAMKPQQVADLVAGFCHVQYYDRALFDAVSANVSANFTKFETHQLLPMLNTFAKFNHYSTALFDDIGDSIAYCNHYLAPMKAPACQVRRVLGQNPPSPSPS